MLTRRTAPDGSGTQRTQKERRMAGDSRFDGRSYITASGKNKFDVDFTMKATIRSHHDGTIVSKCSASGAYSAGQCGFVIHRGCLAFELGHHEVQGRRLATDGMWHRVAVVFSQVDGHVRLYIDGHEDGRGNVQKATVEPEGLTTRVGCGGDWSKYLVGFKGDICDPSYSPWSYSHHEIAADAHTALSASPSEAMSQPLPTVWEPEQDLLGPDSEEEGYVRPSRPRKMVNTCRKTRNSKRPIGN